jgi:hypothetical protein
MFRTVPRLPVLVLVAQAVALGCIGQIGDGSPDGKGPGGPGHEVPPGVQNESPTTAIPRLSQREVERSIVDVFGIVGAAEKNLAPDPKIAVNPANKAEVEVYDTLAATKSPSQVFVDGMESLAFEVARDFSADTGAVDTLAGCTPVQPLDDACLRSLIETVGLRLWRRPMEGAEVDALVAVAAPLASDPAAGAAGHYVAARAAIAALIMSPEFVYRSEIGQPAAEGVVRLGNHELMARLSYFLWGTAPSPDLLVRAAGPDLSAADVADVVDEMLADARGVEQMRSFHALWLRYTNLLITDPDLAADMRAETDALVERALGGESGDWTQLFTSEETFATPALAAHYGLDEPGEQAWIASGEGRAGLLSHGSFLSLSQTKQTDTLPSRRGAMIGRRLLCQVILPPPKDVAIDKGVPVPEGACKIEAYKAHAGGTCQGCHATIDGIGFGFERYDGVGRYREIEQENASCEIEGAGSFAGESFSGPSEFVAENMDAISDCAVVNLLRFAVRDWNASEGRVEQMAAAFRDSGHDFAALMRAVAVDPLFRHRRDGEASQ